MYSLTIMMMYATMQLCILLLKAYKYFYYQWNYLTFVGKHKSYHEYEIQILHCNIFFYVTNSNFLHLEY